MVVGTGGGGQATLDSCQEFGDVRVHKEVFHIMVTEANL